MQLILVAGFAVVLSVRQSPEITGLFQAGWARVVAAWAPAWLVVLAAGAIGVMVARRTEQPTRYPGAAQLWLGRGQVALRAALLGLVIWTTWGAGWPRLVRHDWGMEDWVLVDEMLMLAPLLTAMVGCWAGMYPADQALRRQSLWHALADARAPRPAWGLGGYLLFQVRHQMLMIVAPLSLIVAGQDLLDRWRDPLFRWTGLYYTADLLLVVVAGAVFLIAPLMLRYIWSTRPLPDGPLREALESISRRARLRYRQILLWRSHGMIANAAVMGLAPPVRYVLLTDGLLEQMDRRQIEGVFGHEVGHVRLHHITYYLIFAAGTALLTAAVLGAFERAWPGLLDLDYQQVLALLMMGAMWVGVFGWLSRRFERQADVYGVGLLAAEIERARVVPGEPDPRVEAADVFARALLTIAELNGINPAARSWRHSSIASRGAFVRRLAACPADAVRFEQMLRRVRTGLLVATAILGVLCAWLYTPWG